MIAIIDYDAGNVRSLQFALQRLGAKSILTNDPKVIKAAEKVIFPGQGAAGSAMRKLKGTGLDKLIPILNQPVLGICLGMQLFCEATEEGEVNGLGIIKEKVIRFSNQVKVPQMGWNKVSFLLENTKKLDNYYYFANSYYSQIYENTLASAEYGHPFAAAVQKDNFIGCQFHPEKSSSAGIEFLDYFLSIN